MLGIGIAGKMSSKDIVTSRIKFRVRVVLPRQDAESFDDKKEPAGQYDAP